MGSKIIMVAKDQIKKVVLKTNPPSEGSSSYRYEFSWVPREAFNSGCQLIEYMLGFEGIPQVYDTLPLLKGIIVSLRRSDSQGT